MQIHLIINPQAGNGKAKRAVPKLCSLFREMSVEFEMMFSRCSGDATALARSIDHQAAMVVAVGGDGTVNEVVNGIMGGDAVLGVIPIGTGNDFARLIGATTVVAAARLVTEARVVEFDVAEIQCANQDGSVITRCFINTMGVGFDAVVAAKVAKMKHIGGMLPYLVTALRTLWSYRSVPATLRCAEYSGEENMFLATIGNGTTSGGGFILTPRAKPDDGVLDLCFAKDLTKRRVLNVIPKTFSGGHLDEPEILYFQSKRFELEFDAPLPIHVDGEILTEQARRIVVSLSGKKLRVLTASNPKPLD